MQKEVFTVDQGLEATNIRGLQVFEEDGTTEIPLSTAYASIRERSFDRALVTEDNPAPPIIATTTLVQNEDTGIWWLTLSAEITGASKLATTYYGDILAVYQSDELPRRVMEFEYTAESVVTDVAG